MANDKKVEAVIEVSNMRRDDCLRKLGQARQALEHGRQQLEQLRTYTSESQARWNHRASQGVSVQLLHHHRQFMARIDEAVVFQQDVLKRLEADLARCETLVIEAERELAALKKYAERKRQAAVLALDRQDQKLNDEMASNVHRRQVSAQPWRQ